MMRVVGKAIVVAIALSLVVTGSAMAAGQHNTFGPGAIIPGDAGGIGPRDFLGTGFEQSEGFNLGTISAVNGWKDLGANNAFPPGTRGSPTAVVAKGNGSAQGYSATQNFNHPVGTFVGARSPTITSVELGTLNWDFRMDDNGGADYFCLPQAPSQTFVVAYFGYQWTGYLYAVNYIDGPGVNFNETDLGFWDTNWNTYQMVLSHPGFADTTISYYAGTDKDHLQLLSDVNTGQSVFWPAGNRFEEVLLVSDNAQNTGNGNFAGDGEGAGYFDNLVLKPEPGTLAMLGAGLLIALRRKSGR